MATVPTPATVTARFRLPSHIPNPRRQRLEIFKGAMPSSLISHPKCQIRRTLTHAVNQDAEKSFKKTLEVDRLIDLLKESNAGELEKLVVENVLAFNEGFWIRLAARTDTCKSDDDKKDYEELAVSIMSIVDRLVHKTNEKIESATNTLKRILKPVLDETEEVTWPPRDPEALKLMEKEIERREQEGQLDEGFLSEVNAQLRQSKEDGDKPGLEAMLQKALQIYASKVLSKRSYANKGGTIIIAEKLLESIIEDLKLGISEKSIFHEFHPDAEDLFNVTCDLKLVCEKLRDRGQRHKRQISSRCQSWPILVLKILDMRSHCYALSL